MSEDLVTPEKPPRRRRPRNSIRRWAPRKRTVALKSITRAMLRSTWGELGGDRDNVVRPRTRGECPTSRPCPFVSCRHHNYLEINPETGSITFNRPDLEPHQMENSCSLDVADLGGRTLEEVGEVLNITRERVRQIEVGTIVRKLKNTKPILDLGIEAPLG